MTMVRLKRVFALIVAAILVGVTIPVYSQSTPHSVPRTNRALITATPFTQEFNPRNGPASVTLLVTGSTAIDVRARVFRPSRSENGDICPDTPQYFVAHMIAAYSTLAPGSHILSWSGFVSANQMIPDGVYCYRVEWSNADAGVLNLREGHITVNSRIAVRAPAQPRQQSGPSGSTQPRSPNTGGTGGRPGAAPTYVPQSTTGYQNPSTTPSLQFAINPHDIYPESRNPSLNTSIINYRVNTRLQRGLSITIRNGSNVIIQTLRSTTAEVSPITSSVSWNGRSTLTGRTYPAGTYSVVFSSGGEFARGIIRLHAGAGPGGLPPTPRTPDIPFDPSTDSLSVRVHPTTIDPYSPDSRFNTAVIDYTVHRVLNRGISLLIYDPNNVAIRTLRSTTAIIHPHSDSKPWDGRYSNGQVVPEGRYRYVFTSGESQLALGYITVDYRQAEPPPPLRHAPQITDYGPQPSEFRKGGSTNFRFSVNQPANVTVNIYQDNTFIKRVFSDYVATTRVIQASWLGEDRNGRFLGEGRYRYIIEAHNNNGRAQAKSGHVRILENDRPPQSSTFNISNLTASQYDPERHFTTISFTINQPAYISSTIRNTTTVNEPLRRQYYTAGTHSFIWNGTYTNDGYVPEATYTVELYGESVQNNSTDRETTTVFVHHNTGVIPPPYPPVTPPYPPQTPFPPVGVGCGRFVDVPANHPLCPAIDFVTSRQIFAGYQDGSNRLGLNEPIRRGEFLAVIQKAFGFRIDPYNSRSDGTLGYRDLYGMEGQWFMPYIKTFSRLNIMVGYPDHTIRPEKTMGTAELFVSFFQAAERSEYAMVRYRVNRNVQEQPYADTPINMDTYWYIGYAMFSRIHDLVPGEFFYPGRGITRGQVIDLIYQTNVKGIINFQTNVSNPSYPDRSYNDYYYPYNTPTQYPQTPAPVIDNSRWDWGSEW